MQFVQNAGPSKLTHLIVDAIRDLIAWPVSASIVMATKVRGLRFRGALTAVIISSVGLLCPRSSFDT